MEKKKNIKRIIIILGVLFILLMAMIILLQLGNNSSDEENTISENLIDLENTNPNNTNSENTTQSNMTGNDNGVEEETERLQKVSDNDTYFLVQYCLKSFYDENDFENISLDLIDQEAKERLNLNEQNMLNLQNNGFCVDEILQQKINEVESIYVVKYRLGETTGEITNKVVWIRINQNNQVFSIYPYEYLSELQMLDLRDNDVIQLENVEDITRNENNQYQSSDIVTTTEACMKELFRRYKFDLLLDREHLYDTLEEEYRNLKFPDLEDLQQYINTNKADLYLDSIAAYKKENYDTYTQFTGKGQEGDYYIFRCTNLMEYTMFMDNYTVVTIKDKYNGVLGNSQARYCINRVIQAINNKDYEFVYEKLNPIQKNNYYRNFSDFEEFIHNHFYDENNYEIAEEYLIISTDVYQYEVEIRDANGDDVSYRRLTMAVELKEDTDFVIGITSP